MHYHLILTQACNSRCRYCYEKSMNEENNLAEKWEFDFSSPTRSEVGVEELKKFLKKGDVLIFYGGEPLLEIEKIKKIIDEVNVSFRMQTNGKLLDKLPIDYLKKIDKVLVSLDGDKERTDFNRGEGTYEKVTQNLEFIREQNYLGEIVARMTISFPDIFDQVKYLIENGFESVHWQLDAGFYKCDFSEDNFKKFVEEYNNSISKLIDFWIEEMRDGRVLKLYPFVGVVARLAGWDESKGLMCGAGENGFAIDTLGKIIACPIMNSVKNFECGDLEKGVVKKIFVLGCEDCEVRNICGGRCLYWRSAKLWPCEGDELICKTIKHLIFELKKNLPEIMDLIEQGVISKKDFDYEKYFGPEIIP